MAARARVLIRTEISRFVIERSCVGAIAGARRVGMDAAVVEAGMAFVKMLARWGLKRRLGT